MSMGEEKDKQTVEDREKGHREIGKHIDNEAMEVAERCTQNSQRNFFKNPMCRIKTVRVTEEKFL